MIQPRAPKRLNAKGESFACLYSIAQGGDRQTDRQTDERNDRKKEKKATNAKLSN